MSAAIRIVARANAAGIGADLALLREALAGSGTSAAFSHSAEVGLVAGLLGRRDRRECILFLERVGVRWLTRAGRYLLIPNQEWFPRRRVPLLRRIDHVLCKTRHAEEVFGALHPSVHHLGFTSPDQGDPAATPDYGRFLHVAGGSPLKGTAALLEVWARHPEWPALTVVRHAKPGEAPIPVPQNVELISRYVAPEELRALQNACGVHLCPSECEGWGHYIVEAMSCRAVPVVTDAPPMDELVEPARGVRVPWSRSEPRRLGTRFHVDRDALEHAVARLIGMPDAGKAAMGAAGRAWFEANDRAFRARLEALLARLLPE